eukprot:Skav218085  [mRNA]  locus=scaffold3382:100182:103178:- [translate_table: standard]
MTSSRGPVKLPSQHVLGICGNMSMSLKIDESGSFVDTYASTCTQALTLRHSRSYSNRLVELRIVPSNRSVRSTVTFAGQSREQIGDHDGFSTMWLRFRWVQSYRCNARSLECLRTKLQRKAMKSVAEDSSWSRLGPGSWEPSYLCRLKLEFPGFAEIGAETSGVKRGRRDNFELIDDQVRL